MIEIVYSNDKENRSLALIICGHANQADVGQDIVCASASILAYTLAQNVLNLYDLGKYDFTADIKLNEGDAHIICNAKDDEAYSKLENWYSFTLTGYHLIKMQYPQCLNMA